MKHTNPRISKGSHWLLVAVLSLSAGLLAKPSKAFVPYLYQPNKNSLRATSLSIGRTAAQLLQLGQAKEAERLAELSVRLDKTDDKLWAILAEAQLRGNKLEKAKASLKKAKSINPKKGSLWFAEASIELQEKNTNKAIELLNRGLKLEPENAGAYFHLGNAKIMQLKFRSALLAFEKATKLKPTFWEALNNKALVLFEIGDIKTSIKTWREVIQINANAEPMLALAAGIYQTENNNEEALKLAKEALSKNPNYVSTKYQEKQLWGKRLRAATQTLLSLPELQANVERARANSEP